MTHSLHLSPASLPFSGHTPHKPRSNFLFKILDEFLFYFPMTFLFNSKKIFLEFLKCLNDGQENRFIETNFGEKEESQE